MSFSGKVSSIVNGLFSRAASIQAAPTQIAKKRCLVANRCVAGEGGVVATTFSGLPACITVTSKHTILTDCVDISLLLGNSWLPSDITGFSRLLCRAAIKDTIPKYYPFTVDGRRDIWVNPHSLVETDPVGVRLTKDTDITINQWIGTIHGGMANGTLSTTTLLHDAARQEVKQGSTYTNALGKFVVSGAGAGTFTDGVAIDSTAYPGATGEIKWSGATGSGTVTVAGTWRKTDGTTASGNGTATLSGASGTANLTAPFSSALLLDVTNITIAAGITAGTIYAEGLAGYNTNGFVGWWIHKWGGAGGNESRQVTSNTGTGWVPDVAFTTAPDDNTLFCLTPPWMPRPESFFQYEGAVTTGGATLSLTDTSLGSPIPSTSYCSNTTNMVVLWLSGANKGKVRVIRTGSTNVLNLWHDLPSSTSVGDRYAILGFKYLNSANAYSTNPDTLDTDSLDHTLDATFSGTAINNVRFPSPFGILGTPYSGSSVNFAYGPIAVVSHSFGAGAGDSSYTGSGSSRTSAEGGWIIRACDTGFIPWAGCAVTGQQYNSIMPVLNHSVRALFISKCGCSTAIVDLFINDVNTQRSLSQIQTDHTNLCKSLREAGIKRIIGVVPAPETYSGDGGTTQYGFGFKVSAKTNGTDATTDPVRLTIVPATGGFATPSVILGDRMSAAPSSAGAVAGGPVYYLELVTFASSSTIFKVWTNVGRTVGALIGDFNVNDIIEMTEIRQRWVDFSAWIRGGAAGTIDAVVDLSDIVCTARDTPILKPTYYYDSIHVATPAHIAIAATMDATTLGW